MGACDFGIALEHMQELLCIMRDYNIYNYEQCYDVVVCLWVFYLVLWKLVFCIVTQHEILPNNYYHHSGPLLSLPMAVVLRN